MNASDDQRVHKSTSADRCLPPVKASTAQKKQVTLIDKMMSIDLSSESFYYQEEEDEEENGSGSDHSGRRK